MKILNRVCTEILFVLCVLFLGGCVELPTGQDLRIEFPQPPPLILESFGQPSWELTYACADAERTVFAAAGRDSVSVRMPAGPPVPIVCRMVFGGRQDLFYPAGGLWPQDGGSRLRLDWEKGFAADFLIRLRRQGYPVDAFNSGRFFRETVLRGAGNPWALNEELIITTLAGLSFRADRIKPLPAHPVKLPLPAGTWLPRNPLVPALNTDENGVCNFGYLAEGYHRYYRTQGGKADIQIKGRNAILYAIAEEVF